MIRCSKCKRFVKNVTYEINRATEEISNVRGDCSRCGEQVPCDWDCYEDLVGYSKGGLIENGKL